MSKPLIWVWLAVVVILLFFANTVFLDNRKITERQPVDLVADIQPANQTGSLTISPQDPSLGLVEAPITIIELADFGCSHCAQSAFIVEKFVRDNLTQVRLIWKDFILPVHPQSAEAAEAAQCAARQGKFWEYQQYLFANQDRLGSEFYSTLAQNLSLDASKFNSCLVNNETLPLIQFNQQEINSLGLKETPSYIINGQLYNGEVTEAALTSFLNQ
ncbi:MAG: thioredoxin domain-containing protein [Patescibacteria group bacterium]